MNFKELLHDLGLARGDVLYVHSSFSRLRRFGLSAEDLLDILCEQVGSEGTIAMPSFAWNIVSGERPWVGYAKYLQILPALDVLNTPTNIGWLPEKFRLRRGVLRSAQGIWPITAWGRLAATLTRGQELLSSPYGPGSSFSQLIGRGAKLVGLGVTLNTTSLCPVVDWELGEAHTQQVFTPAAQEVGVVLEGGRSITTRTYSMSAEAVRGMSPSVMFGLSDKLKSELNFMDMGGDFFFSYPSGTYHLEATRLGRRAIEKASKMPWLERLPLKEKAAP